MSIRKGGICERPPTRAEAGHGGALLAYLVEQIICLEIARAEQIIPQASHHASWTRSAALAFEHASIRRRELGECHPPRRLHGPSRPQKREVTGPHRFQAFEPPCNLAPT